jgi:hypothetical protein
MARIKKNNKDVFQSYVLTTAKYDFSVYEKRIMYRLVEMAQKDVVQPLRENLRKIEPSDCGVNITMPVSDILKDETDKNYEIAKKAFRSLSKKGLEYEDEETWFYTSVIEHPKIDKGIVTATSLRRALFAVGKRYLGYIGVALMVADFYECMNS